VPQVNTNHAPKWDSLWYGHAQSAQGGRALQYLTNQRWIRCCNRCGTIRNWWLLTPGTTRIMPQGPFWYSLFRDGSGMRSATDIFLEMLSEDWCCSWNVGKYPLGRTKISWTMALHIITSVFPTLIDEFRFGLSLDWLSTRQMKTSTRARTTNIWASYTNLIRPTVSCKDVRLTFRRISYTACRCRHLLQTIQPSCTTICRTESARPLSPFT
jgi:hypothetical protein